MHIYFPTTYYDDDVMESIMGGICSTLIWDELYIQI
jgi:hypothetical protein